MGQVDLQECCPEIHLGLHTDHEMTGSSGKTSFKYSSHFYSLACYEQSCDSENPQFIQLHIAYSCYELYKVWVLTITTLSITPCRSKGIKMAAILKTGFPSPMHKDHTKI